MNFSLCRGFVATELLSGILPLMNRMKNRHGHLLLGVLNVDGYLPQHVERKV